MFRKIINKIIKTIKKNYIYINITLLILAIYVIFFPIISLVLEKLFPRITICPYLTTTGNECPLCGGTRYIKGLGNIFNDITYLFNFFGIIIGVIIFNIMFRSINIVKIKKNKNMKNTIIIDIIIHTILLITYIGYEIIFILK